MQPCSFGFVSSDPTVCSTVDFPPLENSDHVTVSVSIYFLSTSKGDTLHCLAFDYHRADWDDLYDHLRHAVWDWVVPGWNWCISLIVNIRSSLTYRNHFFHLPKQNKSSSSQVKFRKNSNFWKQVLQAAKFAYVNKTKRRITSQKLGSRDFC